MNRSDGEDYTVDEFHPIADSFGFRQEDGETIATLSGLATRESSGDRITLEPDGTVMKGCL